MNDTIVWECQECGYTQEWPYWKLARDGNPICLTCGADMEWIDADRFAEATRSNY